MPEANVTAAFVRLPEISTSVEQLAPPTEQHARRLLPQALSGELLNSILHRNAWGLGGAAQGRRSFLPAHILPRLLGRARAPDGSTVVSSVEEVLLGLS